MRAVTLIGPLTALMMLPAIQVASHDHKPASPAATSKADAPKPPPQQKLPPPTAQEVALQRKSEALKQQRDAYLKMLSRAKGPERQKLRSRMSAVQAEMSKVDKQLLHMRADRFAKAYPVTTPKGSMERMQVLKKQIEAAKDELAKLEKNGARTDDPKVKDLNMKINKYMQEITILMAPKPGQTEPPKL